MSKSLADTPWHGLTSPMEQELLLVPGDDARLCEGLLKARVERTNWLKGHNPLLCRKMQASQYHGIVHSSRQNEALQNMPTSS